MHSLEEELTEIHADDELGESEVALALAIEQRDPFSIAEELRLAAYCAVVLVISGVGILVKAHLDHIGPLTLMLALALAGIACYVPAARARARDVEPSTGSEYLLLLGALILSADAGFAESQFHWWGSNWSRQLLLLTVMNALTAYALRSRLVLSLALSSLAGWFSVERGPENFLPWNVGTAELGARALVCSAVTLVWRQIDVRTNAARFAPVFEHFAANIAFWGVIGWCVHPVMRPLGVLFLLGLAAVCVYKALRSGAEAFAVYGVLYTAVGLSCVLLQLTHFGVGSATLVLVIALVAAAVLRRLHDTLKAVPS